MIDNIQMKAINKIIVSHIARIKSFRQNITEESLINIYTGGFQVTASIILIGNFLVSSCITCSKVAGSSRRGPASNIFLIGSLMIPYTLWSISKATIYGVIWPLFVPYALSKQVFMRRSETLIWNINQNGLIPHIFPMWSIVCDDCQLKTEKISK
jgi:hypothetical protein